MEYGNIAFVWQARFDEKNDLFVMNEYSNVPNVKKDLKTLEYLRTAMVVISPEELEKFKELSIHNTQMFCDQIADILRKHPHHEPN